MQRLTAGKVCVLTATACLACLAVRPVARPGSAPHPEGPVVRCPLALTFACALAELEEEVHKLVQEVDGTRAQINDAATLHAQNREAHAERMARLEHQAAQLSHARQLSGPLHLNGFNLRPSADHDHVEPSTAEDEAKYLEAAIRASLSLHNQMHTPTQSLDRPHSTQSAPPKRTHETSSGRPGGGLNSEDAGLVPAPGMSDLCHGHGRAWDESTKAMQAPQTEPRRIGHSDYFARPEGLREQEPAHWTARGTGGAEMNGGAHRMVLEPQSQPIASGHTPISPARVYRAFEQTQADEVPAPPLRGGGHQRPDLNGGSHSEWLDFEERDPQAPTSQALARVRDGGSRLLSEPDPFCDSTRTGAPARRHAPWLSANGEGPAKAGEGECAGERGRPGGSAVSPVKMESLSSLTKEEEEWDLTDADRMSDHESGGEQEPGDASSAGGAAVSRIEACSALGGEGDGGRRGLARWGGDFGGDASCVGADGSVDAGSDDLEMPVPADDLSCSPSAFESPFDEDRHLSGGHQGLKGTGERGASAGREGAETPPLPEALEEQLGSWNEVARGDGEVANAEVEDRSGVPRVLVLRPAHTSSSAPTHTHVASSAMQQDHEAAAGAETGQAGSGRRREKDRGIARSHRPEPPPKVVVTVETQAKTFRCLVLPTDTWGHLCAMVQVRSLARSLARAPSSPTAVLRSG